MSTQYYNKIYCSIYISTTLIQTGINGWIYPFYQYLKKLLKWGYKGDRMKRMKIMQHCLTVQWPHPAFHLSLAQFDSRSFLQGILTCNWTDRKQKKYKKRISYRKHQLQFLCFPHVTCNIYQQCIHKLVCSNQQVSLRMRNYSVQVYYGWISLFEWAQVIKKLQKKIK